jgi:hypothetical protein
MISARYNPAMALASTRASASIDNLGLAWVLLCVAFCVHVADEASTGFLTVYNPTVIAMRARLGWFPMPTFEYREWLVRLILVNLILLALTPFAYRNARGSRPLAYFFAGVMVLNGLGHTLFTVLGQTVPSVQFPRPAPGFYSSPFLLITSSYLFLRLRATRKAMFD